MPARIMNEGTSLDTAKRWLFNKNDTSPKKEFHFDADKIPKKKVTLSLPKPGQLLTEDSFMENSRWWEA